jgi:hypothetical protein
VAVVVASMRCHERSIDSTLLFALVFPFKGVFLSARF